MKSNEKNIGFEDEILDFEFEVRCIAYFKLLSYSNKTSRSYCFNLYIFLIILANMN